ncbi:hypothetical protein Desaci_2548 [Desulfosporosinus acidiphilus SJ4]|uniref:Uncharacterized protein n=1 Tax=Desulfosporosinus acidiphilus (strain DSM 22704 / JCM 16185 / SJ4) TaxID=646529 RepID=I4D6R6_DESAJ|nr:hypothetical protein [Desulfosporosinus acidiphilus]AFM41490.1 hypothetical protein Desaci_2548 [Desulfosporosinus acidiphilus SJ4]
MAQLEYRLLDEEMGFPALFGYESIPKEEVIARCLCDYFVKEFTVYELTSSAKEEYLQVIYVKKVEEKPNSFSPGQISGMGYILLEFREFLEEAEHYPLLKTLELGNMQDLLMYAVSQYINFQGSEWEKTSFEIDEDRQVFSLYLKKSTPVKA